MPLENYLEWLQERRELLPVYGLGLLILLAGASKFLQPGVWAAYEPEFVAQLSPVPATVHMYVAGAVESIAGILLLSRKRVFGVSVFLAFWLAGITLGVLSMGFWSIALRDVAWVILAFHVALSASHAEEN
jgi:hypothetical protein